MEAPLALYRRYRPDTFAEVIGQDHVTEPLRNALANNRVNHAYLFSGPRGCGKTTSARILARAINCEKGPAPEPCGECQSCRDLARGGPGSIDVIEIDAASHGGVDDARDLRERAFFAPVQSRYKIYIIDEAHMVTTQGFNALLKLVEEPPPHLKFIFATTEPDKVIGTIRSRTHHYPFRLVPPKTLAAYLAQLCSAEGVAIEPAVLPLVVRAGAGSVRDSLSVLDQLIGGAGPDGVTYALAVSLLGFTPDSLLDAIVDGFAARDAAAVFSVIDKVIETGQDPKRFAEDLLRRLRDLVIVAAVPTAVSSGMIDVAEDQGERLQSQAAGLGAAELTRAADTVAAGLLEMRGATAPRLQLELVCAKVLLPGADDSTQGVHARLDRIERRMTLGGTTMPPAESAATPPPPAHDSAEPSPRSGRAEARAAVNRLSGDAQGGAGRDSAESRRAAASHGERPGPAGADVPAGSHGEHLGSAGPDVSAGARGERPGGGSEISAGERPGVDVSAGSTGEPAGQAQRPAGSAPGAPAQTPAAGQGVGEIGLADVRRLWPQILQRVRDRKKVTWVMLSQNAQVLAMDDAVLTIGLSHAGVRDSFVRSGHDEILREALRAELLVDRRIEAVVDPSAGGSGGATSGHPAGPTSGSSSSWGDSAAPSSGRNEGPSSSSGRADAPSPSWGDAPSGGAGEPPSSEWGDASGPPSAGNNPASDWSATTAQQGSAGPSGGPAAGPEAGISSPGAAGSGSAASGGGGSAASEAAADRRARAASKRRAAEAAVAVEQAQRQRPPAPAEADEPPIDEADVIGEDDVILEDDTRTHTELLRDALGAEIIEEQPNT